MTRKTLAECFFEEGVKGKYFLDKEEGIYQVVSILSENGQFTARYLLTPRDMRSKYRNHSQDIEATSKEVKRETDSILNLFSRAGFIVRHPTIKSR